MGTESGLGRSDRQLSEEHSSPAPCCCLYRWCSTRNCSSARQGGEDEKEGEVKLAQRRELTGREREDGGGWIGRNSEVAVEREKVRTHWGDGERRRTSKKRKVV